ncbi:hypothetical protein BDR26DRAFT_827775 [Obelidium mucronatum]|nr:hypothetical protein BDR26DRAFT_827775 [Obelidium mucronatum]
MPKGPPPTRPLGSQPNAPPPPPSVQQSVGTTKKAPTSVVEQNSIGKSPKPASKTPKKHVGKGSGGTEDLASPVGTTSKQKINWSKDAVEPKGKSSHDILIDWLTTEGNYSRWKGDTEGGVTKETLCSEIVSEMITHGIKHRDNNMVRTKIGDLEKSFKRAVDWRANTGQGILDSSTKTEAEKEAEIKLYLKKLCPFYEELEPVMGGTCIKSAICNQ